MRLVIAVAFLLAGCVSKAPDTTLGPHVVLLDESLMGQSVAALEERFGRACYRTDDGVGWNAIQNTVTACAVPTGQVLAVYVRDGHTIGYYLGEW